MVDAQRDRVLLLVYGVVYGPTFRTGTPKTCSRIGAKKSW